MRRWLGRYSTPLCVALYGVTQAVGGDWWTAGFLAVIAWYLTLIDDPERTRVRWYRAGYTRGVVVALDAIRFRSDGTLIPLHVPVPSAVHPDDEEAS